MIRSRKSAPLSAVLGLLFWAFAACTGCTNSSLTPKDTLVVELESPTQTLNPLYTMDTNSQHINELAHSSLVVVNDKLIPEPYLAEEFRQEGDTTVSFKLRKGCKFENGREITAADVEKSLAFFLDKRNESPFAKNFESIKSIEVTGSHSFRVHTHKPVPALLTELVTLKVLQLDGIEPGGKPTSLPGAGPYRLLSLGPAEIHLERTGQPCLPLPPMPKITVKVVRDDISRFLKLKRGELDIVLNDMNYRKVDMVMKDPTLPMSAISVAGVNYAYMGLNLASERLRDPRVRRALALSFDIPTLIRYKSRGMAKPARGMLADMNWYANLHIPVVERNLEEARRLLDEAGYSNGSNGKPPLKLTLKTSAGLSTVENARVLTAQAREAGIIIDHKAFDWGVYFADVKSGNTELYTLSWTGISDPGLYRELFHSSQIGKNNRTRYNNPAFDKEVDLGEATLDTAKRRAIYNKVQEIAAEDLPFISLWHPMNTAVFRKEVKGVTVHPLGTWRVLLTMRKE